MITVEIHADDVSLADACDDACAAERLKALIDDLGPGEVYAATRYVLFLRSVSDPFSRSSDEAPMSDEEYPLDDDDDPDRFYTQEEMEREFGL